MGTKFRSYMLYSSSYVLYSSSYMLHSSYFANAMCYSVRPDKTNPRSKSKSERRFSQISRIPCPLGWLHKKCAVLGTCLPVYASPAFRPQLYSWLRRGCLFLIYSTDHVWLGSSCIALCSPAQELQKNYPNFVFRPCEWAGNGQNCSFQQNIGGKTWVLRK